jgi:hypothetical protein
MIDLAVGYRKSNASPILQLFLSRLDQLVRPKQAVVSHQDWRAPGSRGRGPLRAWGRGGRPKRACPRQSTAGVVQLLCGPCAVARHLSAAQGADDGVGVRDDVRVIEQIEVT